MENIQIEKLLKESKLYIKDKEDKLKLLLTNIIAKGHTLIEDTPGIGKTSMVKFLCHALDLSMSRVQFTNDLLPADILGVKIFDKSKNDFFFHKGAIFGEMILADELNRASPRTQSALLQAMEEGFITIEGESFELPEHFYVVATQNPYTQIGTSLLPESQLDRFSLKMDIGYACENATIEMLKEVYDNEDYSKIPVIIDKATLEAMQKEAKRVHIEDDIYQKIYSLLEISRTRAEMIGLSNRCGQDLVRALKAWTFISGRDYVIPDDLHYIFPYVCGHRLIKAESSSIKTERSLCSELLASL